jgi:MFS transporter, DHA3 family, macrolide efflux protein
LCLGIEGSLFCSVRFIGKCPLTAEWFPKGVVLIVINRRFTYLFLSTLISTLCGSLSYIAIYWNFSVENSLTVLALLTTCYFVSRFFFSLFLSPLADLHDSQWLMKATMLLRSLLLLAAGGSMLFFHISSMWILLMAVLQTALESVYHPASSKLVTKLVEEKDLSCANALLQTLDSVGALVGLAVGGLVVAVMSLESILLVECVAYLAGGLLIGFLPRAGLEERERGERTRYFQVWKEGLQFIFRHNWLMAVLAVAILANLAIAPTLTLLAPYASTVLGGGSTTFSYLEIAIVIGSIGSGLVLSKLSLSRLSFTFVLAGSLQASIMILLGFNAMLPVAMVLLVAVGFAIGLFNIPFVTMLQRYVPNHMLGRVRGGLVAASKLASSIGYFLSGFLSDQMGVSSVMILFGGLAIIGIVIVALIRPFQSMEGANMQTSA